MRIFLLTICLLATVGMVRPQAHADKITPQEYIEANEFAHAFWKKLVRIRDIEPLVKEFSEKNFYPCIMQDDFVFLKKDQLRPERNSQLTKFYLAETNFMLRLMLWGSGVKKEMEDEDNPFALLPRPVRLAFSEESWAAISAGEYDWKNPPTDAEANAYFDLVLTSFERANPIFLKHLIAVNAGFTPLSKKRFAKYYEEEYIFRPELGNPKFSCSYQEYIPRQIIVDIPFFQLRLGKIDGTLKVLTFPFHVDD